MDMNYFIPGLSNFRNYNYSSLFIFFTFLKGTLPWLETNWYIIDIDPLSKANGVKNSAEAFLASNQLWKVKFS